MPCRSGNFDTSVDPRPTSVVENNPNLLHDDAGFREQLTKMTEKRQQIFEDLVKTCPAEAPEVVALFSKVEVAFGLDGALPALSK